MSTPSDPVTTDTAPDYSLPEITEAPDLRVAALDMATARLRLVNDRHEAREIERDLDIARARAEIEIAAAMGSALGSNVEERRRRLTVELNTHPASREHEYSAAVEKIIGRYQLLDQQHRLAVFHAETSAAMLESLRDRTRLREMEQRDQAINLTLRSLDETPGLREMLERSDH